MNCISERKAQRQAGRKAAEADKLVSQLSAVRAELAKVSHQPVAAKSTSSSSAEKIAIQPGKQSAIFLQAPGDHAHQITFSFREPDGSGTLPKDNTSSIPWPLERQWRSIRQQS
jgi:hypothetical protein